MELEAAKGILAEVFGVRLSEVDEMIWGRFEVEDKGSKKKRDYGSKSSGWNGDVLTSRTATRGSPLHLPDT
ncbi:MAG: hypothetical protein QG663_1130 [Thermodesulfobacteriota bacterium]|nr:hypothetical protein [Thermodesulfobacteriota bacterium]